MSMNLSAKLDELQRGDRQLETTVALCEIRTQLQELTKSVESCQSEVSEVKRDMVAIKVLHSACLTVLSDLSNAESFFYVDCIYINNVIEIKKNFEKRSFLEIVYFSLFLSNKIYI